MTTILPPHIQRDARNLATASLSILAYRFKCEVPDILALLSTAPKASNPNAHSPEKGSESTTPNQQPATSRPPAAEASTDAPVDGQAEGDAPRPSATPLPETPADPLVVEAKSNADIIRADLALHPNSTAAEIAARTGIKANSVSTTARVCKIAIRRLTAEEKSAAHSAAANARWAGVERKPRPVKAAPAPKAPKPPMEVKPARVTIADQIKAHLVDHPNATSRDIADAIGKSITSVAWAALKAGITLRKLTPEEHAESVRAAVRKAEPARSLLPKGDAIQPDETVMGSTFKSGHRVPNTSSPTRFYVRDKAGRYLHQSLERSPTDDGPLMTINRAYAWFDNAQRFAGAAKKWPEIEEMRKEGAQP